MVSKQRQYARATDETTERCQAPRVELVRSQVLSFCLQENFLPYFARRGYDAHAVSLRGHGASDFVPGAAGSFSEHIKDLGSVVQSLGRPPILVAHSLGGIFAQRSVRCKVYQPVVRSYLHLALRAVNYSLFAIPVLSFAAVTRAVGKVQAAKMQRCALRCIPLFKKKYDCSPPISCQGTTCADVY